MEEKKVLYFKLLGDFTYGERETAAGKESDLRTGRKALSLLQYLIVNHNRSVSSEELIEIFWADGSAAPAGALRHMIFKVRNLLKEMFPEQENLLVTCRGGYTCRKDIPLELDTERLEAAVLEAGKQQGEEQLELLMPVLSCYKGDFLPANDSQWAITLRQYYRALYLDACKRVLPQLYKKENWLGILMICEQAYRIDFTVEEFTVYQMRALIALGQPGQAAGKYEAFRDKLLEEFGIAPAGQMEQVYMLALGLRKRDLEVPEVLKLVCEGKPESCAFFRTFEIFQSIVALEKRHLARTQGNSTIVVASIGEGKASGTDARRLENILQNSLRAGDPVARLEAGSYILMLTGTDLENARLVTNRLDRTFHKAYQRSKARITYHFSSLKPV